MLDAVLCELVPVCENLAVPIYVSDNGSEDDTPEVCERWAARWSGFRFQRHPETVPFGHSIMSAMEMSDAEYTWLSGDDDYLAPSGVRTVHQRLSEQPDALVVRTIEVPEPDFADLEQPLAAQLDPLVERDGGSGGTRRYDRAEDFFAEKHIILPAPSVIYPTDRVMATDYGRYVETHHAHIGSLFDALSVIQEERGRVDVLELDQTCSVSLTVHNARGKDQWSDVFRYLALEGFPKWLTLLPAIYTPYIPIVEDHLRHIFRGVIPAEPAAQHRP